ncbi:MAG: DUF2029 domain-containing protein [Deltaproteobacteria bacterium]|nr:DUF2029 domain-containing protein [Deltaproteobacteria bacterium]
MMLLLVLFVWLGLSGQFGQAQAFETETREPGDLVEYWASARLLLNGENPYSPEQMLLLQRTIEPNRVQPLLTWNPPWTLFFTAPFGLISFAIAQPLWLLMSITCLILCSPYLWRLYGGDPAKSRIAWLVCFGIIPTYMVLSLKQITPLLVLGIVGFLYFSRRKRLFLSGLSLTLVAIKPHLAYLFWLALLFWTVDNRQWRIMCGVVFGIAATTLLPLLFVPDIFSLYFQQYSTQWAPKPLDWQTPTLSAALGYHVGSNAPWVRAIPALLGFIWFTFYWNKHRQRWDWVEQMPLLLLTSQVATPFAWTFDQILLLPALMEVAVWTSQGTRRTIFKGVIVGFMLINAGPLIVAEVDPNYFWLFWMVPLYLLAYMHMKQQSCVVEKCLHLR